MDRRTQLVARFLLGIAEAIVADPLGRSAKIFVPVDRETGLARDLGRAQQLGAADQRELGLAGRDLLGEAVHQILRHVSAGVAVEQLARRGVQAARDALGRVGRAAEWRGEARADVAEELHHRDRIDLVAQHVAADLRLGILERGVGGLGAEGDPRAFARRFACGVRDLAAADQDGSARIDHFNTTPASASTLSVSSPRSGTRGPLCIGEPENRNGGAGDL